MNTKALIESRATTHGDFEEGAFIFSDITRHIHFALLDNVKLAPRHAYALSMIATKIARILQGDPNEKDHWADIAGYATLGGQLDKDTAIKSEESEETQK